MSGVALILGVLAGLVGVAGMTPYIRDTVRRSTRPHRGTWLIWGVLAIAVCMSQRADGASWSLVMAGTQVVLNAVVILLAIRLGTGALSPADAVLITLAGVGVAGWLIADEPIVATACVVAADLIATGMMLPKTWRDPDSETLFDLRLREPGRRAGGGVRGRARAVAAAVPDVLLRGQWRARAPDRPPARGPSAR